MKQITLTLVFFTLLSFFLLQETHGTSAAIEKEKNATAEFKSSKSVGLTLSGGGAKGLAHVGVLHVLDSVGVQIEYIGGTSMGSIVGAMYAAGYSASEIERFALELDWQSLFSRRTELSYTHPRRKESYGRYILEIPIEDWQFVIPSGAIEGQQMWNVLSELFFHVQHVSDFNELPIPFFCVATDVETGEPVIMDSGDLVTAVRASMAIPSVFTTVNRGGKQLIDGGVVENFPVAFTKERGADYVIGVNVSQGLRQAHELRTPVDILYQMGFYLDARNFVNNRDLTDLYIEPDLMEFTAASFQSVEQIIEKGKQAARLMINELEAIKEQQDEKYPVKDLKAREKVEIIADTIQFEGLENIRPWFVRNALRIDKKDTLTLESLNRGINRLYATDYFNRITYHFIPRKDQEDRGVLVFIFDEKPFGRLSAAIHYSSFTGVGLIGNLSTNKLFFYNTGAYLKALIGEKPAVKAGLDIFTSDRQNRWFNIEALAKYIIFPVYDNYENIAEYKQTYFRSEASFLQLTGANSYISLGGAYYYQSLTPNMRTDFSVDGYTQSNELFFLWKNNSLNRHAFPQQGIKFEFRSTYYFNQRPSLTFNNPDGTVSRELSEVGIEINDYLQFAFNWESYIRLSPRLTSFNRLQVGYNLFYEQSFINMFNLGGTYSFLKNQMTFAGLNEYEVISKAAVAGTLGWQYNAWDEFYLNPLVNAAVFDFELDALDDLSLDNFVLGTGLSIGYLSAVGPLEVTFSYSPQTDNLLAYINLGWTF